MTRQEIEPRIKFVQKKLSETSHIEDLKSLNRTLERLIMMEADDDD